MFCLIGFVSSFISECNFGGMLYEDNQQTMSNLVSSEGGQNTSAGQISGHSKWRLQKLVWEINFISDATTNTKWKGTNGKKGEKKKIGILA